MDRAQAREWGITRVVAWWFGIGTGKGRWVVRENMPGQVD